MWVFVYCLLFVFGLVMVSCCLLGCLFIMLLLLMFVVFVLLDFGLWVLISMFD